MAPQNKFADNRDALEDLCRRRFFYRPAFEIYGGTAGFWTYGPPGSAVKNNLIALWRKHFVIEESLMEVEDTCIMPHPVLKASGHVDRFTDFMVKDLKDPSKFYRADKLLEDHMEVMMAAKGVTPAQREEYEKVKNMADGYTKDELHAVLQQYGVKSPETKNDLSEPYAFNLMFPTPIGPSGLVQGYLRPETAQGIFLNYPFCLEQNGGQMPFGVAQIGKAFRNEIAPRQGLLRQREFTQAEIEFFCKPGDKPHPKFASVAHLELSLFSSPQQLAAQQATPRKLGEAVAEGLINNETLGYFIARTFLLSRRAGILAEHIRFRQHLPTEMAHYASDCWDMEVEMSYGWIECVGIADRSAFDLTSHANATGKELSAREKLETPVTEQAFVLGKKAAAMIGKDFKAQAKAVSAALAALSSDALVALSAKAQADGSATLALDGGLEVTLTAVQLEGKVESKTVHERVYVPNVVEPSFGIDRLLTAIYEHSYYVREGGEGEEKGDKGKSAVRAVLRLTPEVAPYKCIVCPLDARVTDKYAPQLERLREHFSQLGVQYKVDETSASVGKRYARNDELGIPFGITVDFDTLDEASHLFNTVTLRERDSTDQLRVPLAEVADAISKVCLGSSDWAKLCATYPTQEQAKAAPAAGSTDPIAFLRAHNIEKLLNAAVNDALEKRPADPIKFIAEQLLALPL
mmetsp:Transcript_21481/g.50970  ORF Transcript_21481/g.50970 Transcript_21481/m.50970 type:complete len:691 (-) Transcript_21481:122-2194(-)